MLKVDVRKEPGSVAVLDVEVPEDLVQDAIQKGYLRLGQRVNIPGFRRGKAPRAILERMLGKEAAYDEALQELIPRAFAEAASETGIRPIARPQIDVKEVEDGKPLRFTASVEVEPEVTLGDYRSLRLPRDPVSVPTDEVDRTLESLRQRRATLTSKDGGAAAGDFVLMRIEEAPEGHERFKAGREILLEVSTEGPDAPFVEALRGAAKDASVELPGNDAPPAKGTILDVRTKVLPPLDDDFARIVSKEESLAALRAALQGRLEDDSNARAREDYESKVVAAVVEGSTIDLPKTLPHEEVNRLLDDLREQIRLRGLTWERYLELNQKTDEQIRDELEGPAERRVRARLVLEAVAEAESLEPAEQDLEDEIAKLSRDLSQDDAQVRAWLAEGSRKEGLRATLRRRKAIHFLTELASGED
ncbi:MAG: trigger factor [Armatimonadetes bacterium]|nr:trigger factor [Armatimonadota bacterium]